MWENGETFRKTDIMENCCDVALYPLGLEPFERPVGLQLSSHLSDKDADSGRVLPDVMFMFQTVSQSLTSLATSTHTFLLFFCSKNYSLRIYKAIAASHVKDHPALL